MSKILVAEDDRMTRSILCRQLQKWDYTIIEATNGEEALQIIKSDEPPSIVLLDWIMPLVNGIEVCHKIKEEELGNNPYVIMITSKAKTANIVEALDAGADDFMSKPINNSVLHSRINVAIRTKKYLQQLHSYAHQMEELAQTRAQQLVHADRLVTVGTMASSIVHEINNPLSVISSSTQIFAQCWPNLKPVLENALQNDEYNKDPKTINILKFLYKEYPDLLSSLKNNTERIDNIIQNLKRFFRKEKTNDCKNYDINEAINNSLEICQSKIKNAVQLNLNLFPEKLKVFVNSSQLDQVIVNIIINAIEAIKNKDPKFYGTIKISTLEEGYNAKIVIENNGPAISENMITKIWESFYTTKESGTGLGLYISLDIIKSYNGMISVENLPDNQGVRFCIILPLSDE